MNKKVMSLLLSLILVVTSVFVSNIVAYAAEPSGGLKVTATSNYFPRKSSFIAIGEEYVTVTYFINSNKDMLNTQWKLDYDPACLEFENAVNRNEAGDDLNLMPSVDNLVWKVITNEGIGEQTGRIQARANELKLYKFSGKGYIPFVTATFKVIGSGETTVDLFVDYLTLSKLGSNFMSDPTEEEVIVDSGVIKGTPTVPKRETAVHSGLYDPCCDITAPVISGVEDGKTYCSAQTVTVSDNDAIEKVTVNEVDVTLDEHNQFTRYAASGKQEIIATDKAGNSTTVTVTINDGHTYGAWQSNGKGTHIRYCTVDGCSGYEDGKCTGGEATCTAKAECDYCGEEYGELDSSNHSLENIHAKDATVTETGNKEYWQCENCNECFADKDGNNSIDIAYTVIPKLQPEIIKGIGQSITAGEKKALSFTSNAAFDDFKRVGLDGSELSGEYYEKAEGSIIITLDADYVATLPAGEHTIGIVSESGIAETTFTVVEKAAPGTTDDSDNDNDSKADVEDSAKTGDNTNLALWLALMLLSGAGITGVTAYTRRKRTNE